jgi:RimJ/RimL family protein N-acetyltransferase
LNDAPRIQELVGEWDVARNILNIPFPYPLSTAVMWIEGQQLSYERGMGAVFALMERSSHLLIGAAGLGNINREYESAEIGFWIGKPYWNFGYATEAVSSLLGYGFGTLGLNRIQGRHFARNPASGRVMEKCGMKYEGCLRQYVKKWGDFEDVKVFGMLKGEVGNLREGTDTPI